MGALLERGVLIGGDGRYDPGRDVLDSLSNPGHDVRYELTGAGREFLTGLGVVLPTSGRAVTVTAAGQAVLAESLAIDW